MFNTISWQGYWVSIAFLTAGYYLIIYLLYFRKDFSFQWGRSVSKDYNTSFPLSPMAPDAPQETEAYRQPMLFDGNEAFQLPEKDSLESMVYTCTDEINAYLEEAKKSKCVKEELLYALHAILRKYPAISTSEYKASLTAVIVSQCEYHCSVHLGAEDVVKVWVGG
ncbi:MAG TPA: hypothetical protein VGN63_18910 [Flavisolibacter sp.]|jgi:hypothetical protein|nr:hypothetical protein [Flavisolibacter sp.]